MNLLPAFTPRTLQAIDDITSFHMLPPQIDYRLPFRRKADQAEEYLDTIGNAQVAYDRVNKIVEDYYDSPIDYLDTLF